eukprot:583116-Pyramimonas_sp.AAC.1
MRPTITRKKTGTPGAIHRSSITSFKAPGGAREGGAVWGVVCTLAVTGTGGPSDWARTEEVDQSEAGTQDAEGEEQYLQGSGIQSRAGEFTRIPLNRVAYGWNEPRTVAVMEQWGAGEPLHRHLDQAGFVQTLSGSPKWWRALCAQQAGTGAPARAMGPMIAREFRWCAEKAVAAYAPNQLGRNS